MNIQYKPGDLVVLSSKHYVKIPAKYTKNIHTEFGEWILFPKRTIGMIICEDKFYQKHETHKDKMYFILLAGKIYSISTVFLDDISNWIPKCKWKQ